MARRSAVPTSARAVGPPLLRSGLVELLVVLVVLGLIAALAVQGLSRLRARAAQVACEADVRATSSAAELYRARHARYPRSVADLRAGGFLSRPAAADHTLDYRASAEGLTFSLTGMLPDGGGCATASGGA